MMLKLNIEAFHNIYVTTTSRKILIRAYTINCVSSKVHKCEKHRRENHNRSAILSAWASTSVGVSIVTDRSLNQHPWET